MHIYSDGVCSDQTRDEPGGSGGSTDSVLASRVGQLALSIIRPLARLFVAHGLTYAVAEKLLKQAFYDAGLRELGRAGIPLNISRISVSTGLHRRDVKRMKEAVSVEVPTPADTSSRSLASEVYLRWSTLPQVEQGELSLPLRPTDGEFSFDELARTTNQDAHPRALLEELKRLKLVSVDQDGQQVWLKPGGFVPLEERSSLLGLLGDNVAAHLDTSVCNVLDDGPKRLEQAIYEYDLTPEAIEGIGTLSREIWANASQLLVPALISAADESAGVANSDDAERYQVRIGMYMYTNSPPVDSGPAAAGDVG